MAAERLLKFLSPHPVQGAGRQLAQFSGWALKALEVRLADG